MPAINCGYCRRFVGTDDLISLCPNHGHGFHRGCVKRQLGISPNAELPSLSTIRCSSCHRSQEDRASAVSDLAPGEGDGGETSPHFQALTSVVTRLSTEVANLSCTFNSLKEILGQIQFDIGGCRSEIAGVSARLSSIDTRLSSLETVSTTVVSRCDELECRVEATNSRMSSLESDMERRLGALESFNSSASRDSSSESSSTAALTRRIQSLELKQVESCLIISGLPDSQDRDDSLLFMHVASELGVNLTSSDVIECSRVRSTTNSDKPRALFIRLRLTSLRDSLLSAKRRKGALRVRDLTMTATSDATSNRLIYINEFIPRNMYVLLKEVRSEASARGYKFVWYRGGRILVKKDVNSSVISITDHSEILSKLS
ncbi:hypothetical protein KPH14_012914 [Odynerus spinipes]|uniref:FP protein C-terminal domain-containing protein n=1 Tax=Odynerus spinipes TaxID=1348599 RepID=A0AAD9RDB8_9HYME|nr:hypothetical protein KPH14_012914 [Odynerus spinipes]